MRFYTFSAAVALLIATVPVTGSGVDPWDALARKALVNQNIFNQDSACSPRTAAVRREWYNYPHRLVTGLLTDGSERFQSIGVPFPNASERPTSMLFIA